MKKLILKIIGRLFPELTAGTHLPLLGRVVAISCPPIAGGDCSDDVPRYAVDIQLLNSELVPDVAMPIIPDVPLALACAGASRGIAAFPAIGTVVELAFAYGMPNRPFIRSVLPYGLPLVPVDANAIRIQQAPGGYLEIDGENNCFTMAQSITRQAVSSVVDRGNTIELQATTSAEVIAPRVWLGSAGDNFLQIVSEFMVSTTTALQDLAVHIHDPGQLNMPATKDNIIAQAQAISTQNARVESIKKQ